MEQNSAFQTIQKLCYKLSVEKKVETRRRILSQLNETLINNIRLFRNSYKLQKLVISIYLKFIEKLKTDCIKKNNYKDASLQKLLNFIRDLRKLIEHLTHHIKKAKLINELIIYARDSLVLWPLPLYEKTVQENSKILRLLLTYKTYRDNISNQLKSNILGLCMQKLIYNPSFNGEVVLNSIPMYEEPQPKSKEFVDSEDDVDDDEDYIEDDDDEGYTYSTSMETEEDSSSYRNTKSKVPRKNNNKNNTNNKKEVKKSIFPNQGYTVNLSSSSNRRSMISKLEIIDFSKTLAFLIPSMEIVYNDFVLEEEQLFNHPSSFDYSTLSFLNLSLLTSYNINTRSNDKEDQNSNVFPSSTTLQTILSFFKAYFNGYINNCNIHGGNSTSHEQKSFIQIVGSMNFILQEILRNNFLLALKFALYVFDDLLSQWDTKLLEMKIQIIHFFRIFILILHRPKTSSIPNSLNKTNDRDTTTSKNPTQELLQTIGFSSDKIEHELNKENEGSTNDNTNKNQSNRSPNYCPKDYLYFDYRHYLYRLYSKIKSSEGSEFIGKFNIGHIQSKEVSFGEFISNQQKFDFFEPSISQEPRTHQPFSSIFSPLFLDDITPKYTPSFNENQTVHFNNSFSSDELIHIKWAFYNLVSDLYYLILKLWQNYIDQMERLVNDEKEKLKKNKASGGMKFNQENDVTIDNISMESDATELLMNSEEEKNKNENNLKMDSIHIQESKKTKDQKEVKNIQEIDKTTNTKNDCINIELDILKSLDYSLNANKKHIILFTIQIMLFLYKKWGKFISRDFTDKLVELLSMLLTENESLEVQIWVLATLAQTSQCYANNRFSKNTMNTVSSINYEVPISSDIDPSNKPVNSIPQDLMMNVENILDVDNPMHLEWINRFNLLKCINPKEITWNSIWNTALHKVLIYTLVESSFYCLSKIIQENVLSDSIIHSGCHLLWKNIQAKSIPLVPSGVNFVLNYLSLEGNSVPSDKYFIQNLLQCLLTYFQTGVEVIQQQITPLTKKLEHTVSSMIAPSMPWAPHSSSSPILKPSRPLSHQNSINMPFPSQLPSNLFSTMKNSIHVQSKFMNKQQNNDHLRFYRTPQLIAIFLGLFVTTINLKEKSSFSYPNVPSFFITLLYNQFQHYIPTEEMAFEKQFYSQYLHLNYFNYGLLKQFTDLQRASNSYHKLLDHFQIKEYLMNGTNSKMKHNNSSLLSSQENKGSEFGRYSYKHSNHLSFQESVHFEEKNQENDPFRNNGPSHRHSKLIFYSLSIDNEYKSTINTFLAELIHHLLNSKIILNGEDENENDEEGDFINIFNNDHHANDSNFPSIKRRRIKNNLYKTNSVVSFSSDINNDQNQTILQRQSTEILDNNFDQESVEIDQEILQKLRILVCWKIHFLNICLNFVDILLHTSNQTLTFENLKELIENYYHTEKSISNDEFFDMLFPDLLNEYTFINLLPELLENINCDLTVLFKYEENHKEKLVPIIEGLENCFNLNYIFHLSSHDPFSLNTSDHNENNYYHFINMINNAQVTLDSSQPNYPPSYINFFTEASKNSVLLRNIYYKLLLKEKNINELIQLLEKYFNLNVNVTFPAISGQKRPNTPLPEDDFVSHSKDISVEYDMNTNKSLVYTVYYHPFIQKPKIVYLDKMIATTLIELISINISKNIQYQGQRLSLSDFSIQPNKSSDSLPIHYTLDHYNQSITLLTPQLSNHCQISFLIIQFIHLNQDYLSYDICKQIINTLGEALNNLDIKNDIWTLCIILRCLHDISQRLPKLVKHKEDIAKIIKPFLKFFVSKCHILNWRVKVEFINFLVDCIIFDHEENIFQMDNDLLMNTYLNFINDQEKYVRFAFTLRISNLFTSFSQSHHVLFYKKINQCIRHDQNALEYQISYAYQFYAIAKHSFICRNDCLYQLLFLSCQKNLSELITHLLENLANDLGAKNYQSLIKEHLPSLIYLWVDDENAKLSEFPYQYLNLNSLEAFFLSSYKIIVPNLILKTQYEEVDFISNMIHKPVKEMIIQSFSKIMAFTLPLLFQDNANLIDYGKAIYNKYIKLYLPGEQFKNSCKENIDNIIMELLYLIYDTNLLESYNSTQQQQPQQPSRSSSNSSTLGLEFLKSLTIEEDELLYQSTLKIKFPNYKGHTVLKAIDYIINLIDEGSLVIFLNQYRLPTTFNFFHKKIETTIYNEERHRLIYIYKYIISLIQNQITHPFLYKSIILRMIRYMREKSMLGICSGIIEYILENSKVSNEVTNENILQIISLLYQYINDHPDSYSLERVNAILSRYTPEEFEYCPKFIRNALSSKTSIDRNFMGISFKSDDDMNIDNDKDKDKDKGKEEKDENGKETYFNDIIKFNIDSNSSSSIMITIKFLQNQLNKKNVLDHLNSSQNKEFLIQLFSKIFSWKNNAIVSRETLKCIGQLHPFLNDNIMNSFINLMTDQGNDTKEKSKDDNNTNSTSGNMSTNTSRASTPTIDFAEENDIETELSVLCPGHIIILKYLSNCIYNNDISIVSIAIPLLQSILRTSIGSSAFHQLDEPYKKYLNIFISNHPKVSTSLSEPKKFYFEFKPKDIEKSETWSSSGKTFNEWITQLSCTMIISFYTDEIFDQLIVLIEQHSKFSEYILSYIFYAILFNEHHRNNNKHYYENGMDEESKETYYQEENQQLINNIRQNIQGSACDILSRGVSGILKNYKNEDPEALRTILSVLIFLRQQPIPNAQTQFDNNRWLNLNYNDVVHAAIRCNLYTAALMFIEIGIDYDSQALASANNNANTSVRKRRSHMRNKSVSSMIFDDFKINEIKKSKKKWYQDLLIDIFQHTDPDDFYALNYNLNKNIRPLIKKYEHERNWRKQISFYERSLYTIYGQYNQMEEEEKKNFQFSSHGNESSQMSTTLNPHDIYFNIAKSLNGLNLYHLSFNLLSSVNSFSGYFNTKGQYQNLNRSLVDQNDSFLELQYESAWKISQWDFEPTTNFKLHHQAHGIHYYIFNCLKFLKRGNKEKFSSTVNDAWSFIENNMKLDQFDVKKNNFLPLQLMNEIQEGWEMIHKKIPKFLDIWQARIEVMKDNEFKTIESILMLRTVILNIIIESLTPDQLASINNTDLNTRDIFKSFLINNLFSISKIARKTGNLQSAQNSIEFLHQIMKENEEEEGLEDLEIGDFGEPHHMKLLHQLILEEAKILWIQDEPSLAINMLRQHIDNISPDFLTFTNTNPLNTTPPLSRKNSNASTTSSRGNKDMTTSEDAEKNEILYQLLSRLGNWIGMQRLENPTSIIENYMEKAVKIIENGHYKSSASEVYFKFADYANDQYQVMCQPDICVQQKLLKYKEKELDALKSSIRNSKSTNERNKYEIQKRRIETQIELDKAEINRVLQTREMFLVKAIENFLKTLVHSDEYDICVFRLIALWFKNKYNTLINQYIYKYIKVIESRKFLTLIYQLSARMSIASADKKTKYFVLTVNALIQKMIIDHPYHCLYQIIALRNGDILSSYDIHYFASPEKRKQNLNSGALNKQSVLRIQAAAAMLNSVKKHRHLAQLIQELEFLSEAYIELASLKFSASDRKKLISNKKPISFGNKLKLSKVKELERVPVTTKTLAVDPTCAYKDIVFIKGYKPYFQLIGGINLPKVIECLGSDGQIYKQLVKGSDDLRQDAVLSKIFTLVNVLLNRDQSTRKKQLSIRTYHIIPLSPRSGIIEWVKNTIPFGTYLTEAHPKYNKNDIMPLECRMMLHNEQQKKNSTPKSKLAVYNSIEAQFKPVFRYFFQERFKDPFDWYNKKISYTKSVSVNSVTGWVVGLGDRHCMNILIDLNTAEAIHIDLGIAFDAGKLLSIPECIPFRLTRDVVDGMGINKVEGVFRKSCEDTLKVLRTNSNVLLTILDVFRYDPLYNWTISPLKMARQVQEANNLQSDTNDIDQEDIQINNKNNDLETDSSENKNNDDIERAFLGVKSKLSEQMGIECQINELIEMAMNPENLSRLFPGWQPYM